MASFLGKHTAGYGKAPFPPESKAFCRNAAGDVFSEDEGICMGTWKTRGLRGSALENLINLTNEVYRERGLALIQKIPIPITPVAMDKKNGRITLAYFNQKSTVDYIGVVQGVPVCFDAKECNGDTFALANIHPHQIKFMEDFEKQQGVAFFILQFVRRNECYYVPFRDVMVYWERMLSGGRKSFTYEELRKRPITGSREAILHYLEPLSADVSQSS